eukprot:TRINITY_DN876_c0_g1_i1.p1 TRINITY_DN876_c0_g1~~TRINITY_DN876_c0_g1_i1.p1  ORF type:complete len:563 (-),score=262.92 TRINITY_DN876_c0_g1_i1:213-1901(-)
MDAQLKNEIAHTIKTVCETFTIQYTKAYVLALVKMIKEETQAEPKDWHLEKRPTDDMVDHKVGFLTKEGAVRKNWKKRWFVVRPNYTVDYYESEAESQKPKGKKKGTMGLAGYYVVDDPNQGTLVRLKRLAEKMGVDFSNLPKPKEYPPLTFELYHSRRRCYYIQAANKEEFDDWVAEFRKVCWRAYGLTIDERCHQEAFPVAVRKTRWELGRWGWYGGYGSEEQIMCDMISDELEYEIMGRIYGKLSGPWMVRNMLRNQVSKTIDSMVMAAVRPAWQAMAKVVADLRPKIEPKIRELVTPIFEAQNGIVDKMKNAVMSIIDPLLQEHVCPHLGKIVDILKSPMREGFDESYRIFGEKIDKWEHEENLKRSFRDLDWFPHSYWQMRDATEKTEPMYEPLWALRLVFQDIYPWGLIWKAQNYFRKHTDRAVYTWEKLIKDNEVKDKASATKYKEEVLVKFRHDGELATTIYFAKIMKLIVMPPFEALLIPAAKVAIDPLAEAVPEALKDFLDIKQMFEDLYNGIVDAAIDTILASDKTHPKKEIKDKKLEMIEDEPNGAEVKA